MQWEYYIGRIQEGNQFFGGDFNAKKTSNTFGQANHSSNILVLLHINKTQLNDWLNVELYNDNLKMFNQSLEGKLLALGNDMDEHVLENMHERQMKKINTHETSDDLMSARHRSEKREPRSCQIQMTMINDMFQQQQQNMFTSPKERSRDKPTAAHFSKGTEEKSWNRSEAGLKKIQQRSSSEEIAATIESAILGISRIAHTS